MTIATALTMHAREVAKRLLRGTLSDDVRTAVIDALAARTRREMSVAINDAGRFVETRRDLAATKVIGALDLCLRLNQGFFINHAARVNAVAQVKKLLTAASSNT